MRAQPVPEYEFAKILVLGEQPAALVFGGPATLPNFAWRSSIAGIGWHESCIGIGADARGRSRHAREEVSCRTEVG